MVEYASPLDAVFGALADPTRRDILRRVAQTELSVSEIALPYPLSLADVSKHIQILGRAQLVTKRRDGRYRFVSLSPLAFQGASEYLQHYLGFIEVSTESLEIDIIETRE